MASVSSQPIRSISFPARSHPTTLKIEQTLNKLKCQPIFSSDQSTSSSRAEPIQLSLLNLVELYNHVQELILSLSTQQGKLVEEALESSMILLDACSNVQDLVLGLKERVWDLQSALRRKGYSSTEKEISLYMSFRKKVAKDVSRSLKMLKQGENKYGVTTAMIIQGNDDPCLVNLVRLLREVYSVSSEVFRSVFLFLSTPTKASGWGLISRFVNKNSEILNEVSMVDMVLLDGTKIDEVVVREKIEALDASLEIFEGEIGCLFRCLLKNRVHLLNIFTH